MSGSPSPESSGPEDPRASANEQRRLARTLEELADSKVDNAGGRNEAAEYYAAAAEAEARAVEHDLRADDLFIADARQTAMEAPDGSDADTQDPSEHPDTYINQ